MLLEKTDKTVKIIEKVIKTICPFYDENEFLFDKSQDFIARLRETFREVQLLDFENLGTELWNSFSNINQTYKLKNEINKRFEALLNWQKDHTSIPALNVALDKQLVSFKDKQQSVFQSYTPQEKIELLHYYARISHRLFKAKLDLNKLIREIEKKETEQQRKRQPGLSGTMDSVRIQLSDNKKEEFNLLLQNMIDYQFFVTMDNSSSVSKEDVLNAFGKFLNTQFNLVQTIAPEESTGDIEIKIKEVKSFPEFILHEKREKIAVELRKEFSNEKGKTMRLLLGAMEFYTPPLLTIGNRQGKEIYNSMSAYFNRDIGTYQSIFGHIINHKSNLEGVDIRLNHILKKTENE